MNSSLKTIDELLDAVPRQPKLKRSVYQNEGRYPIIDQSKEFIAGYTDDETALYQGELPVIVFGDHTRVLKFVSFPFCVGADGTQLIRPVKDNDIYYFYYVLRNIDLKNYGYERHFKYLKLESISLPQMHVQKRIAGILSAYDELIENSQRRIKILETMARSLYREWFVHFRYPGHESVPLVDSPLGNIPQGWKVKLVKDIIVRQVAGTTYRETELKHEGSVPVIDQSTSEILGYHNNPPDHMASSLMPKAIFGDHTCKMQLLIEPFSVGPNVVPFEAKPDLPTTYAFYVVNNLMHTQEYKRHWIPLNAKEVIVADTSIAQQFASLIQPILVQQASLRKVILNLRRTRDLLLPRLLSGQIELDVDLDELELVTAQSVPLKLAPAKIIQKPAIRLPANGSKPLRIADAAPSTGATDKPPDINDTERIDVLCEIRALFSDGVARDRATAIRDLAHALGYQRTGSRIQDVLSTDLLTAVRRGILVNDHGEYTLGFRNLTECTRESIKNDFESAIGRGWINREDAIRAFARWLGFARVGKVIDDTARSLINGLIREDRLETDGSELIRRR